MAIVQTAKGHNVTYRCSAHGESTTQFGVFRRGVSGCKNCASQATGRARRLLSAENALSIAGSAFHIEGFEIVGPCPGMCGEERRVNPHKINELGRMLLCHSCGTVGSKLAPLIRDKATGGSRWDAPYEGYVIRLGPGLIKVGIGEAHRRACQNRGTLLFRFSGRALDVVEAETKILRRTIGCRPNEDVCRSVIKKGGWTEVRNEMMAVWDIVLSETKSLVINDYR